MNRPAAQFRVPRIAEEALVRARLSVVPRVRSTAPRVPFLFLVSALVIAGVVGLLLFNTNMQKASFEGRKLEAQRDAMMVRHEALRSELQTLRNPERLKKVAQSRGMVRMAPLPFMVLGTGEVLGVSREATAADAERPVREYKPNPMDRVGAAARR